MESLIATAMDETYSTEYDYLIALISNQCAKSIGWFDKGPG
jgi:hypothetical protein